MGTYPSRCSGQKAWIYFQLLFCFHTPYLILQQILFSLPSSIFKIWPRLTNAPTSLVKPTIVSCFNTAVASELVSLLLLSFCNRLCSTNQPTWFCPSCTTLSTGHAPTSPRWPTRWRKVGSCYFSGLISLYPSHWWLHSGSASPLAAPKHIKHVLTLRLLYLCSLSLNSIPLNILEASFLHSDLASRVILSKKPCLTIS